VRRQLSIAALATTALLLAGCEALMPHSQRAALKPQVSFDAQTGVVSVSPDPIVFRRSEGTVVITWGLPAGSPARFARDNPIVIEGKVSDEVVRGAKKSVVLAPTSQIGECRRADDGLTVRCVNKNTETGYFKYTIQLERDGRPLKPLDPGIFNMP
jgi:hypothetical protein